MVCGFEHAHMLLSNLEKSQMTLTYAILLTIDQTLNAQENCCLLSL